MSWKPKKKVNWSHMLYTLAVPATLALAAGARDNPA